MGSAVDAGIEGLRTAARRAAETGAWQEAEARFRSLLAAAPDDQEALNVLGTCALMHGRLAEARWLLEQALRVDPRDGSARKNLGLLYLQLGDLDRARAVLAQAVADDPRHVVALLYLGVLEERAGRGAAALAHYTAALVIAGERGLWLDDADTPAGLVGPVARARSVVRAHRAAIADRVLAPLRERHGAAALARVARCVDNLLGRDTTRPASPRQRPKFLYFPGLPETPFLARDLFPWAEALEAQWERIRDEMLEVLEAPAALIPFLGTPPPGAKSSCLDATGAGPARWDGVFFHRHGRRHDDNCARCPATVAALEAAPLVHVAGHAPETLFSVLGPGSHILPHTGVTNTRAVTHLPLVVPPGCALRVGDEEHAWRPGRCISFDDTFEHEAWNRSDRIRVILLFDVWNPHLEPVEREAIAAFVGALGDAAALSG